MAKFKCEKCGQQAGLKMVAACGHCGEACSTTSTSSLTAWIASVRKKFRLPWGDIPATENWNAKEKEYWEGYEACLADLEKQLETRPSSKPDQNV